MEQRKINEKEDPRVLRTQQLLLQAFSDLFSEKGFHAMTVQDITERARVNRGTFYTHFEDKYAILDIGYVSNFSSISRVPCSSQILGTSAPSACSFRASSSGSRSYTR